MIFSVANHPRCRQSAAGFTLVEMMVSVGLGLILLVGVAILYINGNQCFVAMANYQNLDKKSCSALDILSRDIRGASALVSKTSNSLLLTNSTTGTSIAINYNPTASTLTLTEKTATATTVITNLTGCDTWTYSLYTGVPYISSTNVTLYGATNVASTKVIQMNWRCSRTYLGSKLQTESVQTAQIVLRNKTAN